MKKRAEWWSSFRETCWILDSGVSHYLCNLVIIRISAWAPPGWDFQCFTMSPKDLRVHSFQNTHPDTHMTAAWPNPRPALKLFFSLSFTAPTIKTTSKSPHTHHVHLQPLNEHSHWFFPCADNTHKNTYLPLQTPCPPFTLVPRPWAVHSWR